MKTASEIIEMFRTDRTAAREMVNGWRADAAKLDAEAEEALTEEAEKELAAETVETIREAVEDSPARSAWGAA